MDANSLKAELHKFIDSADEQSLKIALGIIKTEELESDFFLTREHKYLLDERLSDCKGNPDTGSDWKAVRDRTLGKL